MNLSSLRVTLNSLKFKNKIFTQSFSFYSTDLVPENSISNGSIVVHSNEKFLTPFSPPRKAWLEGLDTVEEKHYGFVDLHPDVFGKIPRLDIINLNIEWQRKYRMVSYEHTKVTNEVERRGQKPWPQKGMGKSRHGSKRGPLWVGGSRAHGPRTPTTHFFMLPFHVRINGLTSTLSIKLMQDDLHIVKDLIIPVDDPKYLENLIEQRNWGPSVLFVDNTDFMERNISIVTDKIKHFNLMPAYGLNVHSMLKHDTLVLTVDALKHLEEKLLMAMNRADIDKLTKKYRIDQQ